MPPYDHLIITTIFFQSKCKTLGHFIIYFEDPVNAITLLLRPGFYGPMGVTLMGYHCSSWLEDLRKIFNPFFLKVFKLACP